MALPLAGRADATVGNAIEAAVTMKHRRRLRRLGWERALEPPDDGLWAAGDPAPRQGCSLDVLVDGAQALPAIAEALQGARRFVYVTGWHLAPHFELVRGEPAVGIGALLAELAERIDVRVLVWAGAPVPAFHPTRKEVEEAVRTLTRGTRIQCRRDPREHPFHCHHEKTLCIDGEVAFVNGIDLTDDGGDRLTPTPIRLAGGWAGTTSARACVDPRWPTCSITSPRAGTRSPGNASSARIRPPRRARARCRSCAPSPRTCTTSSRAATSASWRATCARCAAPSG